MTTALMDEIQRQKNVSLKKAVELSAFRKADESLDYIESISEYISKPEGYERIAKDYASFSEEERAETLIVSGTRNSIRQINQNVREQLGKVGQGIVVETLQNKDMKRVERKYAKFYAVKTA